MLAFSNAPENRVPRFDSPAFLQPAQLSDDFIDPVFRATVEATEEAVLNALVAAETMTGRDGNTAHALPHDELREVMRRYGRLRE
jgi:D-aminopeptidase